MNNNLPTKLKKEPLVDAVFEIRFSMPAPASNILPGIFFKKLKGKKLIERMSSADLPQQIRDVDPNLQFLPVIRIKWETFAILISDRSVAVACIMPYVGWAKFKTAITKIVAILSEVGTIDGIQRYSMKYVDLIPFKNIKEQISAINLSISLGDHALQKDKFQFRIEIIENNFINVVQIITSAMIVSTDKKTKKEGLVIDIDIIRNVDIRNFKDFVSEFPSKLDEIHLINKKMFLKCITPATLQYLEPTYD